MRNAKKYDDRITIGLVPGSEDLEQLKELGYKTLIDLRDETEKFGGFVERRAVALGFAYRNIPVARSAISLKDVKCFYEEVYKKGSAPLYVFSRFGKKPVVFLLLFETVAKKEALVHIYRKADKMGFRLQGDLAFQSFLLHLVDSGELREIVHEVRKSRPDLLADDLVMDEKVESECKLGEATFEDITDSLLEATNEWVSTRDAAALKSRLAGTLEKLGEGKGGTA